MLKFFSLDKIVATKIIIKGLTSSIGWNLGRKKRSNHLLEPLTSEPNNGTKNKNNKEIINKKIESLKRFFSFKDEKNIKTIIPREIYAKCLKNRK